jgi:hypothetical protein
VLPGDRRDSQALRLIIRNKNGPVIDRAVCAYDVHGVIDGTRTRDPRDHNPVLYQLSYDHHAHEKLPRGAGQS